MTSVGTTLNGRYTLENWLRVGGMGTVWRARDTTTGIPVAVKFLKLETAPPFESPQYREYLDLTGVLRRRFAREVAFLGRLEHPGIPCLLAHGDEEGLPYLVMEYVAGEPLDAYLRAWRPLPLEAAVALAADIAQVLAHAHDHRIVHRDLKPSNIVVTPQGRARVLDFGIAFPDEPGADRFTDTGNTPSTNRYAAPEQLDGTSPGHLTRGVDVYTFGCLQFELLTGRLPFHGSADQMAARLHPGALPPRASDFAGGIPDEIDRLTADLLSRRPADRPDSLLHALAVLRKYLPQPGSPAPDPPIRPDPTERFRTPGAAERHGSSRRTGAKPGPRRPVGPGPSGPAPTGGLDRLVSDAEKAVAAGSSEGTVVQALRDALAADLGARADHQSAAALFARARFVLAEAERRSGALTRAGDAFAELADHLVESHSAAQRELALAARLKSAECLLDEGEPDSAFDEWRSAVDALHSHSGQPSRLRESCRDFGHRLADAVSEEDPGLHDKVTGILGDIRNAGGIG